MILTLEPVVSTYASTLGKHVSTAAYWGLVSLVFDIGSTHLLGHWV